MSLLYEISISSFLSSDNYISSSRSAGMARVSDERRAPNDYRWARQVSALLLIAVVVVIVVVAVVTAVSDLSAMTVPPKN